MRILIADNGEWSWGTSLLLKSGILGLGVVAVLWVGWPFSPKGEIGHALPTVVVSKANVLLNGDAAPSVSAHPQKETLQSVPKKHSEISLQVVPTVMLVDLNSSSRKELETLPGIGSVLADRIVTYRSTNGNFREITELVNVAGIGTKRLQRLQPFASVKGTIKQLES